VEQAGCQDLALVMIFGAREVYLGEIDRLLHGHLLALYLWRSEVSWTKFVA
jgi:hypothetical protein